MRASPVASTADLRGKLPDSDGVYLLLDGARFEDVHRFIYQMDELPEYEPLYRGTFFQNSHAVSPCLVQVDKDRTEILGWFFDKGAERREAVLITSDLGLHELAGHFRKYLEARLPGGKIVLFRYYDPGILHALVPLGGKPQIAGMLAPCSSLVWNIDGVFYELAERTQDQLDAKPLERGQIFDVDDEIYAVMSAIGASRFIEESVDVFMADEPRLSALAGRSRVREFIRLAWDKSVQYNIRDRGEVETMIRFMGCLGSGFDTDPLYPWARFKRFPDHVPSSKEEPESFTRIKEVYADFIALHRRTDGADKEFREQALTRIAGLGSADFAPITSTDGVLGFLRRIYPERYDLLPQDALRGEFIRSARSKSGELGIDTWAGCAMLALLMFMFGSSVASDPLYSGVMDKFRNAASRQRGSEEQMFNEVRELALYMLEPQGDVIEDPEAEAEQLQRGEM